MADLTKREQEIFDAISNRPSPDGYWDSNLEQAAKDLAAWEVKNARLLGPDKKLDPKQLQAISTGNIGSVAELNTYVTAHKNDADLSIILNAREVLADAITGKGGKSVEKDISDRIDVIQAEIQAQREKEAAMDKFATAFIAIEGVQDTSAPLSNTDIGSPYGRLARTTKTTQQGTHSSSEVGKNDMLHLQDEINNTFGISLKWDKSVNGDRIANNSVITVDNTSFTRDELAKHTASKGAATLMPNDDQFMKAIKTLPEKDQQSAIDKLHTEVGNGITGNVNDLPPSTTMMKAEDEKTQTKLLNAIKNGDVTGVIITDDKATITTNGTAASFSSKLGFTADQTNAVLTELKGETTLTSLSISNRSEDINFATIGELTNLINLNIESYSLDDKGLQEIGSKLDKVNTLTIDSGKKFKNIESLSSFRNLKNFNDLTTIPGDETVKFAIDNNIKLYDFDGQTYRDPKDVAYYDRFMPLNSAGEVAQELQGLQAADGNTSLTQKETETAFEAWLDTQTGDDATRQNNVSGSSTQVQEIDKIMKRASGVKVTDVMPAYKKANADVLQEAADRKAAADDLTSEITAIEKKLNGEDGKTGINADIATTKASIKTEEAKADSDEKTAELEKLNKTLAKQTKQRNDLEIEKTVKEQYKKGLELPVDDVVAIGSAYATIAKVDKSVETAKEYVELSVNDAAKKAAKSNKAVDLKLILINDANDVIGHDAAFYIVQNGLDGSLEADATSRIPAAKKEIEKDEKDKEDKLENFLDPKIATLTGELETLNKVDPKDQKDHEAIRDKAIELEVTKQYKTDLDNDVIKPSDVNKDNIKKSVDATGVIVENSIQNAIDTNPIAQITKVPVLESSTAPTEVTGQVAERAAQAAIDTGEESVLAIANVEYEAAQAIIEEQKKQSLAEAKERTERIGALQDKLDGKDAVDADPNSTPPIKAEAPIVGLNEQIENKQKEIKDKKAENDPSKPLEGKDLATYEKELDKLNNQLLDLKIEANVTQKYIDALNVKPGPGFIALDQADKNDVDKTIEEVKAGVKGAIADSTKDKADEVKDKEKESDAAARKAGTDVTSKEDREKERGAILVDVKTPEVDPTIAAARKTKPDPIADLKTAAINQVITDEKVLVDEIATAGFGKAIKKLDGYNYDVHEKLGKDKVAAYDNELYKDIAENVLKSYRVSTLIESAVGIKGQTAEEQQKTLETLVFGIGGTAEDPKPLQGGQPSYLMEFNRELVNVNKRLGLDGSSGKEQITWKNLEETAGISQKAAIADMFYHGGKGAARGVESYVKEKGVAENMNRYGKKIDEIATRNDKLYGINTEQKELEAKYTQLVKEAEDKLTRMNPSADNLAYLNAVIDFKAKEEVAKQIADGNITSEAEAIRQTRSLDELASKNIAGTINMVATYTETDANEVIREADVANFSRKVLDMSGVTSAVINLANDNPEGKEFAFDETDRKIISQFTEEKAKEMLDSQKSQEKTTEKIIAEKAELFSNLSDVISYNMEDGKTDYVITDRTIFSTTYSDGKTVKDGTGIDIANDFVIGEDKLILTSYSNTQITYNFDKDNGNVIIQLMENNAPINNSQIILSGAVKEFTENTSLSDEKISELVREKVENDLEIAYMNSDDIDDLRKKKRPKAQEKTFNKKSVSSDDFTPKFDDKIVMGARNEAEISDVLKEQARDAGKLVLDLLKDGTIQDKAAELAARKNLSKGME